MSLSPLPLRERQHELPAVLWRGPGQLADLQLAAVAGERKGIAAHAFQRRHGRGFLST